MKLKNKLLILILILGLQLSAQNKEVSHQSLYWTRYYNQLSINEKWTWHNEIDNRTFFVNNKHHHFIVHSRLHDKLSKNLEIAFGLTYSLQSPQDPNSASSLSIPELRPNQEINYTTLLTDRLSIQQRFRIDERFIHKNNGTTLIDGYDFNFRFRYKLQCNYKLNTPETLQQTTLKLADELMINAGGNITYNFDQNRIYIALEQVLTKNFSIELGYLNWHQQRASGYQFFDRDIVRLTIYHKIKL
jgi:hypothetical protein